MQYIILYYDQRSSYAWATARFPAAPAAGAGAYYTITHHIIPHHTTSYLNINHIISKFNQCTSASYTSCIPQDRRLSRVMHHIIFTLYLYYKIYHNTKIPRMHLGAVHGLHPDGTQLRQQVPHARPHLPREGRRAGVVVVVVVMEGQPAPR